MPPSPEPRLSAFPQMLPPLMTTGSAILSVPELLRRPSWVKVALSPEGLDTFTVSPEAMVIIPALALLHDVPVPSEIVVVWALKSAAPLLMTVVSNDVLNPLAGTINVPLLVSESVAAAADTVPPQPGANVPSLTTFADRVSAKKLEPPSPTLTVYADGIVPDSVAATFAMKI